jgi:pyruvate,water dikinase
MAADTIIWFDAHPFPGASAMGGKGANLARLQHGAWPTPEGFCISTAAYRQFMHANQLAAALDLTRMQEHSEAELQALCQKMQAAILSGRIPAEVTAAISTAYTQLQHDHVMEPVDVAVRSSATVEDLHQGSFAGVFDSFLHVAGYEALLLHVQKCWASLWHVAALTWMMKCDLTSVPYAMAVIVQRMVQAEAAGVMFTANPISGHPFEIVINSTWGLGEGVVSGQIAADTFVVDECDLDIKTSHIVDKEVMLAAAGFPRGGTVVQPVDQTRRNVPSLSEEQVRHLARLGLELQRQYGRPQDVEWACHDGKISVLQARPIVRLPAYFSLSEVERQNLRGAQQWYLEFREPFSPFGCSLERLKNPVYYGARGRAFGVKITNYQATIHGYIYHHEVMQKRPYLLSRVFQAWKLVHWLLLSRNTEKKFREETIPALTACMEDITSSMHNARDLAALCQQLDKAIKSYLSFEAETVLMNVLANTFCSLVVRFCKSLWKDGEAPKIAALFAGLPNKTAERDAALAQLIDCANAQGFASLFDGHWSFPEIVQQLKSSDSGQKLLWEFERFRAEFGYIWADGSTKDPGWRENSELICAIFKNGVHRRASAAVDTELFYHQVEARLASAWIDSLMPLRQKCFQQLVVLAKRYYPYREDHNHYSSSGVMLIRNILQACGERLVHLGVIDAAEDICQLTYEEIVELPQAIAQGTCDTYAPLIARRKVAGERQKRLTPPSTIVLDSTPIIPTVTPLGARQLTGIPGSPGVAIGPARVVSRRDLGKVQAGDILICDTFRPEWSPVLRYIRGLVTERGYQLSHGANLAREWGLPAVMGVQMATQVIGNGDSVRIDGSKGCVGVERAAERATDWKDATPCVE